MRDLDKVMHEVLALVPDADERKHDLLLRVASISESLRYAAPEMVPMWWGEFVEYLNMMFPVLDTKWLQDMAALISRAQEAA